MNSEWVYYIAEIRGHVRTVMDTGTCSRWQWAVQCSYSWFLLQMKSPLRPVYLLHIWALVAWLMWNYNVAYES